MAIKALSTSEVTRYVPDSDPAKGTPEEGSAATVFLLSPLTSRQLAAINDATTRFVHRPETDEQAVTVDVHMRVLLLAQAGLRGWERLEDGDGNDVEFGTASKVIGGSRVACASDESMDRLSQATIQEIAGMVRELSEPGEGDLKN